MTSRVGMEVAADERLKAEAMSYLFKTEHYEVVLKSGDMERCLPALSGTSRTRASARATRTTTAPGLRASSSRSR